MSQPSSSRYENGQEAELTEAQKIASVMSTRDYFLTEESRVLDEWGNDSLELFKFTGEVFMSEYELKCAQLQEKYGTNYQELYSKCRKEFEAYCILNRKVQKKTQEIENFSVYFNSKNKKRTFFNAWKAHTDKQKYLQTMQGQSEKHHHNYTMKACLKAWQRITMDNIKVEVKNDVLQRTEIQISKIQSEYERLIKTLEDTLQKKLIDLKKEEEEHKLLHDKYVTMYERAKIEEESVSR